ncbi:hypothetical protein Tco_1235354 [Tanacetum coccineum]
MFISGNDLTKKGITMAKPNEYIFVTQKKLLSNNNEGRMVEKSFLEIQGTFLVKIRDNTFNGIIGENVFKHIDNFLESAAGVWFKKDCIGLSYYLGKFGRKVYSKILPTSDDIRIIEADEDDDLDDIAKIFKIKGNLFDNETPLNYEANNTSNTQLNQEYKKENHDPLVCNVRRFEMMKYSFDVEDEYVAIKEHEHSDHSRTNVDACQVYRELFRIMDEGWLMTKAKEE